jgi:ubiquinone biosynthesis protein
MRVSNNLARLSRVAAVLTRHGAGWILDTLFRRYRRPVPGPERLRQVFEELGGTFIKFGQMLALQPDILSIEYCNALFNLLDRVAPFGFDEVERIFVEELGRKPSEIFDSIDRNPLATASIGQVHVAWLGGRKLAVKVQRPAVDTDFAGDIHLMNGTMRLIRKLRLRALNWMIEPMSEFVAWTREELDYRHEARYMRQLRHNARDNPNEHVPEVLEQFTTSRTLAMEFLDGCTVLGYLRALENGDTTIINGLEQNGFDSHLVASHVIDNFLGDVFEHGLFHADLHPANLMILHGNGVGYVDFGITGTISSYSRQNLLALTLAYTRGDLEGMCDAFFRVSAMDANSNKERFRSGLTRDAKHWYENDGRDVHLRKNFTMVMLDMLRLSRQTGIWPERDVIKYIRSAIAIDGLITRFAPTFDLGEHLETACDRYLKWHARRSLLEFDHLIGCAAPLGRLFRDGMLRASAALGRLACGDIDPWGQPYAQPNTGAPLRRRALCLAAFLLTIGFGVSMDPEKVQLGMNLFTSEIALATCTVVMLVGTVRKLPIGG